jgi:hypothetical protein
MAVYTKRSYANYAAWYRYDIGIEKAAMESTSILGLGRLQFCTVLCWGNIFINEHSQDLKWDNKLTSTNSVWKLVRHVSCNDVSISRYLSKPKAWTVRRVTFSFCYHPIAIRLLFVSPAFSFKFYKNDISLYFIDNYSCIIYIKN